VQHLGTTPERLDDLLRAGLIIKKSTGGFYDRFRDRLLFPIHNKRGYVIGFGGRVFDSAQQPKYLNSPETPVFSKGKALYGIYEARHRRPFNCLLVVEGYMDVLSLAQFGIADVVATLGTALSETQVDYLFSQSAELIFCFDGDSAGQAAAMRALKLVLPQMKEGRRARFMILPNGMDPDAFIQQQGLEAFLERMEKAYSLSDFLFEELTKKLDLNHLENRATLVHLARPLIQRVPAGILQQMLYQRLAALAQIDMHHVLGQKKRSALQSSTKTLKQPDHLLTLAYRAIGLLLRDRVLITRVPQTFNVAGLTTDPSIVLLCAIIEILRAQPHASFEAIMAGLPVNLKSQFSTKSWSVLVELIPTQGAEQELLGALQRLQDQVEECIIESILNKSKAQALSVEEKLQLNDYFIRRDKSRVDS
jgi:DNA primase